MNEKGVSYGFTPSMKLRNPTMRNEMRIRRKEAKKSSHQKMRKG